MTAKTLKRINRSHRVRPPAIPGAAPGSPSGAVATSRASGPAGSIRSTGWSTRLERDQLIGRAGALPLLTDSHWSLAWTRRRTCVRMAACGGTPQRLDVADLDAARDAEHPRAAAQRAGAGVPRADVPRGPVRRSALNHVPGESAMPFPWTINPLPGLHRHSCVYCFARRTHEWLEFDSGRDFDSQIVVKTNLVDVLRKELARPSWKREHVALGTNTDPYQRAEGRYRLMPGVIGALADSGTPFSILTKGTLLRRDIPLLVEAASGRPGRARRLPGDLGRRPARRPRAGRADAAGAARPGHGAHRRGLPCGVFLAPVLPGLTDGAAQLDAALGAIAAAGATGVTVIPLHLRPGAGSGSWPGCGARIPSWSRATSSSTPAAPTCRPSTAPGCSSGSRRCCGSTAWTGSPAAPPAARRIRSPPGVPGDEEVGFPAGSLPHRRHARRAAEGRDAASGPLPGAGPSVPGAAGACSERGVSRPGGTSGGRPGRPARTPRRDRRRAGGERQPAVGVVGQVPVGQGQLLDLLPARRRGGRPQVLRRPHGVLGERRPAAPGWTAARRSASPGPGRGAAPAAPRGCPRAPGSVRGPSPTRARRSAPRAPPTRRRRSRSAAGGRWRAPGRGAATGRRRPGPASPARPRTRPPPAGAPGPRCGPGSSGRRSSSGGSGSGVGTRGSAIPPYRATLL